MTETQKLQGQIQLFRFVTEAIRDCSPIPSGHIYGMICDFCTLDRYQQITSALKDHGLIKIDGNHLITWIGPREEKE